jgi:hypothetical protein
MRTSILFRSALVLLAAAVQPVAARAQSVSTAHAGSALPAPAEQARAPELARDAVYFELLGNGLLYSINYDHRFTDVISVRAGMMVMGVVASPVTVNALLGGGSHRLELGAGALLLSAPGELAEETEDEELEDLRAVTATATVGYRFQPERGGLVFRAGFTPILVNGAGLPWFGMSVGYAF